MTVIRARTRRQRRNGGTVGGHNRSSDPENSGRAIDAGHLTDLHPKPHGKVIVGVGRHAAKPLPNRHAAPLTELQATVYLAVNDTPRTPPEIAGIAGVTRQQAYSVLMHLSGKDLVQRTNGKWRRVP